MKNEELMVISDVPINYIYFSDDELKNYIRNSRNNESWLTVNDYFIQIKEWRKKLKEQDELLEKNETKDGNLTEEEQELIKSLQIRLQTQNKEIITFLWIPPKNKSGKIIFREIDNYLFNFENEWYEVQKWERKTINSVLIIAEKSIFYNYYHYLAKSSVNGIIHHSPNSKAEICSCPNYNVNDTFYNFTGDYELEFGLYKEHKVTFFTADSEVGKRKLSSDIPLIGKLPLVLTSIEKEIEANESFFNHNYYLFPKKLGSYYDFKFNLKWFESGGVINKIIKNMEEKKYKIVGDEDFLLNKGGSILEPSFWEYKPNFQQTVIQKPLYWYSLKEPDYGEDDEEREMYVKSELDFERDIKKVLLEWGLLEKEMEHFLRNHITAIISWRGETKLKLNYWDIHNDLSIVESVNPSGNSIKLEFLGKVVHLVNEAIFSKVESNEIISKMASVGSSIAIGTAVGGPVGSFMGATAGVVKAGFSAGFSEAQSAHNISQNTFYQFQHKYLYGGKYPLSLRIEFNSILLNQFRQQREIKGKMAYDYFRTDCFADYLNTDGFFQASIISWNANFPHEDWFRTKIEKGVYIGTDFYEKKLTKTEVLPSEGNLFFTKSKMREFLLDREEILEEKQPNIQPEKRIVEINYNLEQLDKEIKDKEEKIKILENAEDSDSDSDEDILSSLLNNELIELKEQKERVLLKQKLKINPNFEEE